MILTVSDSMNAYLQFVTVLILFVFVLIITYWVTKWIAGYQKGKMTNANMELIESFRLTNNKYIQIIRVGQKYLAVAIGKDSVTMLTEIPEEELLLSNNDDGMQAGFRELFEKVQKKNFSGKKDDRNKSE
ncbi:MAG: flagellar biosynthetic protein FliO [Bacillus sp. (in: Bacteria)]|nr:flagellar biosynthetic protein FliO [Bacillus sp. (in: firmicutes)]MCM1425981.1 flagellar biosynthetic protein FliO [Eubacterium sp.]